MIVNEKITKSKVSHKKKINTILTILCSSVAFSLMGVNVHNTETYHSEEAELDAQNTMAEYSQAMTNYMNTKTLYVQKLSFEQDKHDFHYNNIKLSTLFDRLSQETGLTIHYDKNQKVFNGKITAVGFGQTYKEFFDEMTRTAHISYAVDIKHGVINVYSS